MSQLRMLSLWDGGRRRVGRRPTEATGDADHCAGRRRERDKRPPAGRTDRQTNQLIWIRRPSYFWVAGEMRIEREGEVVS